MSSTLVSVAILLSALYTSGVESFSRGAPSSACDTLAPDPMPHKGPPQNTTVPYSIDLSQFESNNGRLSYTPGNNYTVTLSGNNGELFKGFLVQARLAADGTSLIGSFGVLDDSNSKHSDCTPNKAGITHSNGDNKTSISFTWMAPSPGRGAIRFGFSVVEVRNTYWADERTDQLIAEDDSGAGRLTGIGFFAILLMAIVVLF